MNLGKAFYVNAICVCMRVYIPMVLPTFFIVVVLCIYVGRYIYFFVHMWRPEVYAMCLSLLPSTLLLLLFLF